MNAPITIKNLTVAYGNFVALNNVSFELEPGKLIGIIGPNGSGKSTLLKAILNLTPSYSDEVLFFGKPLNDAKNQLAYVPQRETVDWNFPVSVEEVVAMGRLNPKKMIQRLSNEDKAIIDESLAQVNMNDFRKKQIGALSGGQQQRIFLARALAQRADLILMDEPFVGIDMASQESILDLLLQLKNNGKTIVMVHHDLSTVAQHFDDVLLLNNRLVLHGDTSTVLHSQEIHEVYGKLFNFNKIG